MLQSRQRHKKLIRETQISSKLTDHCFAPGAPGCKWSFRCPLCAGTAPGPAPVAPREAPSRASGSTADRWSTSGCRRRTSRPLAGRTRGSTRSPARALSPRKSRWALGTAPGAPRCSPGSGTPSRPGRRRRGTRRGSASCSPRTIALL